MQRKNLKIDSQSKQNRCKNISNKVSDIIKSVRGGSKKVTDIETIEEFEAIITSENNSNKVILIYII